MDLIGQLIQNKKEDNPLPIKEILTELIQYEKLSRNDRFKHLADNPLLQKKLPYCWNAFQGDTRMHWLLNECSTLLQMVSTRPLDIFADLATHYTKKEQTQMDIVGNSRQYRFSYYSLTSLPYGFSYDKALYLTNEGDEQNVSLAIIHVEDKQINVYHGVVNVDEEEDEVPLMTQLDPFTYVREERLITIPTYSIQGNNDYTFAFTEYHTISMPDSMTICYTAIYEPYTKTVVKCEKSDVQKLSLYKDKLDRVADILLKYEPKPDEKTILKNKMLKNRVNTNENK